MRFMNASMLVGLAVLTINGCGRFQTDYGDTAGQRARSSINGLAGFRNVMERVGCNSHDVQRLSERTARNDVIVWVPKTPGPIHDDATEWFEHWLSVSGRTLVYILPDSGSEVDYWSQTRPFSLPSQRLEYRRRQAEAINERMVWRLNRTDPASNGWFQIRALPEHLPARKLRGPWAAANTGGIVLEPEDSLSIEFRVTDYDVTLNDAILANPNGAWTYGKTGPSSTDYGTFSSNAKANATIFATETTWTPLLADNLGDGIVGVVESDDWPDSQVIVVAGGSILTNFALTRKANRQIAQRIADRVFDSYSQASGKVNDSNANSSATCDVAYLVTPATVLSVRESETGPLTSTGMELLTVWPLSLITIHVTILGLLACLIFLPIFGRPRLLRQKSQTDFGDHLDAVAALMARTEDESFAQSRVLEYLRTVRGEAVPMAKPAESPKIDGDPITH